MQASARRNFDKGTFRSKAPGFEDPVQLPANGHTGRLWQDTNRDWWERSPMRYDWRTPIASQPGTRAYYDEIDRRFLDAAKRYLPWKKRPFETLIPYPDLGELDVLEIGVGQGTHAQLIAPYARSFTGIDLTQAACAATRKRFELAGIEGRILPMDAEAMSFPDSSFDFIWSWGVIHHTSNTESVLREMHRVLRPGGFATVMVYYRSLVQYYLINGIGRGLLRREFWKTGGIHQINQAATDGALARYYSVDEFRHLVGRWFIAERIWVTGQKPDAIPLPSGRLKALLVEHVPDCMSRFLTDRLRFGTFLVARIRRA